jgi:signal transduction histidine kinase
MGRVQTRGGRRLELGVPALWGVAAAALGWCMGLGWGAGMLVVGGWVFRAGPEARRRALVAELHDGLGGRLTGLALLAETEGTPALQREAQDALEALRRCVAEARTPTDVLGALLRGLPRWGRTRWRLTVEGRVPRLPSRVRRALVRGAEELTTNVHRHAGASAGRLHVSFGSDEVHLRVDDDGRGFGRSSRAGGLVALRRRARGLGGDLAVRSGADGTQAVLRIPVS